MKNGFSFAKRRPGAYFNDGEMIFSVQHDGTKPGPSPKLLAAVKAAKAEFLRVWHEPDEPESDCVPDFTDDEYDDDEYDDGTEDWEPEFDCGMDRSGGCGKAGSEECEFECPYNET